MRSVSKKIDNILFSLMPPTEIRDISATKIITADTYDDDGFPIEMGLMDPRLGVIEPGLRCKTCGGKVDSCPGHFGHIDLAMPIIHVGHSKSIKYLLTATCRVCSRALLPESEIKLIKKEITDPIEAVSASMLNCPHCGESQKKITLDKPTTFREEGHKLTPKENRDRLEKIPDEDLPLLGINPEAARPEWMILTALPVPPVNVRPTITLESGDRSEDDLTHKLVDVLRINQRLQENRDAGAPQLIVEDLWELLQYHVTTYFDNQTSGIPPARHRSGRALKTLTQRLKGKEGRFRSNLSGKRVNFSARTVISPDPNLSINEVGVPLIAAMELSVPVRATKYNLEELRALVARGPNNHPGVNYLIRPDARRVRVTEKNAAEVSKRLEIGYTVERHLMDGDIVLFNRQPSLHRMSMMAHRVKVLPFKTFRFNLSVCPPYNADFDGDEMNLHVLQSEEARAEARILMAVQEHILSPRFGGCVIGAIHDHVTGLFLLTHGAQKFDKSETSLLLSYIRYKGELPKPLVENGKEYWTGKQLFSLLLPKDLNLEFRASFCQMCDACKRIKCERDAYVVVRNGKLLMGSIDAKAIGAFKGKILDEITHNRGTNAAREFIDKITKLAIGAITLKGFSTGIDEEDLPAEAKGEIRDVLKDASDKVKGLIDAYINGILAQLPGRSMEETLEVEVMKALGYARDRAGEIASRHLGLDNSAVIMAVSGARGSMLNLSQMAGSIGQQAVRGERIKRGYQDRTLSHFKRGDLGAEARGFVSASYKSGLSPTEYFFHSMGGREGLVDTAVRTSRSGYMQRRLINALEELSVDRDGTVRNTAGTIIQFSYGDDAVDPAKSARGKSIDVDELIRSVLKFHNGSDELKTITKGFGEEEMGLPTTLEEDDAEE